jgi:hypothetical protein
MSIIVVKNLCGVRLENVNYPTLRLRFEQFDIDCA